jgi:hypothetical protein
MSDSWQEPKTLRYTSDYVRRLLLDRHYVYARLLNPGSSIILSSKAAELERGLEDEYSSVIGSTWHLDMIDLAQQLAELPKGDVDALLSYIDDMSSNEASRYFNARGSVSIRKKRQRAIERLREKLNRNIDGDESKESESTGTDGDRNPPSLSDGEEYISIEAGDTQPAPDVHDTPTREDESSLV